MHCVIIVSAVYSASAECHISYHIFLYTLNHYNHCVLESYIIAIQVVTL